MPDLEEYRAKVESADGEIASAFEKRMDAVRRIAEYKTGRGLPVCDPVREAELLGAADSRVKNPEYAAYYRELIKKEIELSKSFQHSLAGGLYVQTETGGYEVEVARGALNDLGKYLPRGIKTLVVSDDGVPAEYAQKVAAYCDNAEIALIPQGEKNKTPETLFNLLCTLSAGGYDRASRVIAVGGGVTGDIAGLAASLFMRGIEFVNIPTTLLAMVDSSVGGKTGCNLNGVKNAFGTFYSPSRVIIDPDTLKTLPRRHIANGLAEALKTALVGDKELFALFENGNPFEDIETVIIRSLKYKISVVNADEKEHGLRRVLNFGHTIGHGIESASGGELLHGECVAPGMLPMCAPELRARLLSVYKKLGLPESADCAAEEVLRFSLCDKKAEDGVITAVKCKTPGAFTFEKITKEELYWLIKQVVKR